MLIDRAYFAANFPSEAVDGARLNASRKQGFEAIFDVWDAIEHLDYLEWLAYMLASAWHETGATMRPVREAFARTDKEAYDKVTAYCANHGKDNYARRHNNGNSYYGRGYVQLTLAPNYKTMSTRLDMGNALYDHPDKAMEPDIAAKILVIGLIEGSFTKNGSTLLTFFNNQTSQWFDARSLVNGDKNATPAWLKGKKIGEKIAEYGRGFSAALRYKNEPRP